MRDPVRPRRAVWPAAFACAALAAVAYGCATTAEAPQDGGASVAAPTGTAAEIAYRNAVTAPPPGWSGPVFQLSHQYPATPPAACAKSTCGWLSAPAPFNSTRMEDWQPYLDEILKYVVAGQTVDLNNQTGWRDRVGSETRWFHVPWMAYDTVRGREFVHGTTNERTADLSDFVGPGELHAALDSGGITKDELPRGLANLPGAGAKKFESWAVGMYNPWGGYAIGQAVNRGGVPQSVSTRGGNGAMPARFPVGALVVKVLFTTAGPQDVDYLKGSPQWIVDRHVTTGGTVRAPGPVWLAQMDVAVRDDRSPTGWVYGTYAYDGNRGGPNTPWWDRMAPVGVQWGNDPQSWPAVDSAQSRPIAESAINTRIGIYQHLGCNKRLAGPVDNPQSGCMSCHQGAYAPPVGTEGVYGKNIVPIFGFPTTQGAPSAMCVRNDTTSATTNRMNTAYFSNVAYPDAFPEFPGVSGPTINLDTSLQLQVAYLQYANWLNSPSRASR